MKKVYLGSIFSFKKVRIIILKFFSFFFQGLIILFVTILKFVNGFSKEIICSIPSTFGSYQNLYQGNVYVYF